MAHKKRNPGARASATGAGDDGRAVTHYPQEQAKATPPRRWPEGAYVTVRRAPDEWVAVIARSGEVLGRVACSSREAAFGLACNYAEKHDLPCLVTRGPQ